MHQAERIRTCLFCGAKLTAATRAREHVFRRAWLAKLGHLKSELTIDLVHKETIHSTRQLVANQLQTGEVCGQCNNGWMRYLDDRVESIVLRLAKGKPVTPSRLQQRQLARWILKTACSFIGTDQPTRRHIRTELLRSVRKENFLPQGFLAVLTTTPEPQKVFSVSSLDAWSLRSEPTVRSVPQTKRLKFGLQIDRVVFICSYVEIVKPVFIGLWPYHQLVATSGAQFRQITGPAGGLEEAVTIPDAFEKSLLNYLLATLDVERQL